MSALALLDELRHRGVQIWAEGNYLRYKPRSGVDPELLERLATHKAELLEMLDQESQAPAMLDCFLSDAAFPAVIMHSRALDRDFVLARDKATLDALTEDDRSLPVLYFVDCVHAQELGLEGLRALLDTRAAFGPLVRLRSLKGGRGSSCARNKGEA